MDLQVSPLWALAVPFFGALLILSNPRKINVRESITFLTAIALLGVVITLSGQATERDPNDYQWLVEVIPGFSLALHLEPLGLTYALIASSLWILNSSYSVGYMRSNNESNQTRFFACFALSIACVMGIALAANMFTLFVFYEALSLATFPLVTHKGHSGAIASGRTYLGILMGSSVGLMLPAMALCYVYAGTLDFVPGGVLMGPLERGELAPWMLGLIFFLFIYGIGKAALMPLHRWLPAAMVAPTPVSALLHAVAVVKAGVFSVVKVTTYLVGPQALLAAGQGGWLVYAAGLSIVTASFIALFQDNLKRRLAYSTISQLSYITLGTALLNPEGLMGATMHISAHAFGKITLFFAAGAIYTAARKTNVSQLDGIGRKMPWTMGAFAVGSLSMIGLPPTAGFVSKWYLLSGAASAQAIFVMVVLLLSTLLNASYFMPIVYRAFFKAPPTGPEEYDHKEAPLPMVAALVCTAAATLALFFVQEPFFNLAKSLVERIW